MKLSIIICTRNRAHAIIGCLDSVAAALSNAAPVDAEIVVVDNASKDETSAIVKKWAESSAAPVNLQFEPKAGISSARNCGLRAAKGELIAFTDDDCRLDKDYFKDLLRHDAADTGPVLRGGRVDLGDPSDLPLSIKMAPEPERWDKRMRSAARENLGDTIVGCNMAMRRTVLERLGFFDERFGAGTSLPGGEDTDYTFRAYLAGIPIEYVPDMAVSHHHGRKRPADGNKLLRNYMLGTGALYVKYFFRDPNLCRQFYWDAKSAVREILSGQNTFLPPLDFSHKDKIAYSLWGAFKYLGVIAKKPQG